MTEFALIWYEIWAFHVFTLASLWLLAPYFAEFTTTVAYTFLICAAFVARLTYSRLLDNSFPVIQFSGIIISFLFVAILGLSRSFNSATDGKLIDFSALALSLWGIIGVVLPNVTLTILGK